MIKSFTIINYLGDVLTLELASPEKSGLLVNSVTGLGQVEAKINTTKLAGSDYSHVNSAYLGERNIVFNLSYMSDDSELDEKLADSIFPTKKMVQIIATTDYTELMTSGIVESNEPIIFNDKGESGCQISILCPDPYWYDYDTKTTTFSGIEPSFEFPFHSDIPGQGDDKIEFGNVRINKEKSVYYTGEAEVGITIDIQALGNVRNLKIYNLDERKQISINDSAIETVTGHGIMQGDHIIISTVRGNKYAILIRDGVEHNILNALAVGQVIQWFEIKRGDNLMTYSADEGEYNMIIKIKHRIAYKGL